MKKLSVIFFLKLIFPLNAENLALIKLADVPQKALYITQPKNEKERLFVINQRGLIHIIYKGKTLAQPFLDISDRVHAPLTLESEEGLTGLAFHPNYQKNGYFYLNYIDKNNNSVVSRFSVKDDLNKADKNSEKKLLSLTQPFDNHNGGHLAFGPVDGMLYISFGDGGKYADPYNNSQNLGTLLGSILRIDVDNDDPYGIPFDNPFASKKNLRPEIFCYGLKNPLRFSFDSKTNDLIINDASKNSWEEVNWVTWDKSKGGNFGWPIMEGKHCFDSEAFCETKSLILPIHAYSSNNLAYLPRILAMNEKETTGCSVSGGHVYRGNKHSSLQGMYIFGDYCSGQIWALKQINGKIISFINLLPELKRWSKTLPLYISSIGEDNMGELYVVDYLGTIYKFISN